MGIASSLTPALVRQCIAAEEVPFRARSFSPEIVRQVCRYGAPVGGVIEYFARRGRCMDYARDLIRAHAEQGKSFPSGMAFFAGELTAGKGRFQRSWHAPAGGLWMTLVLVNTLLPEHAALLPLAAGVACCETVREYGIAAHVKWVNDVHVAGKKLAGILIETMIGPGHGEEYVLIGVGINVNNETFPKELAPRAVSMKNLLGQDVALELLAARLLAKLSWNIGLLHHEETKRLREADGSDNEALFPHPLLAQWEKLSDTIGRKVLFGFDVQRQPQYEARVKGLAKDGGLVLEELCSGRSIVEHSGEIVYLD